MKPIDNFIMSSVRLFEVNPSQTLFSISYKPPTPKTNTKVSFRTHNPHLSSNYRFTTNKSKDVSRLLSALGPRGVSVTPGKIEKIAQLKKKQNGKIKQLNKKTKGKNIQDVVGLATLMVNVDVKKNEPVVTKSVMGQKQGANAAQNSGCNSSSALKKKKNKNKGKKKR